ncbi:MAG: L,D-transpeptidase [Actinomycetota bacterium]|nr:L,D-transpeptidase [Actinomycetota bacterium]
MIFLALKLFLRRGPRRLRVVYFRLMFRISTRTLALSAAALLGGAPGAAAAPPGTSAVSTTPAQAAQGAMTLHLPGVFVVHRQAVTVPDRTLQVSGVVRPYVPGQWVTVRAFLGRRMIKRDRLRVKLSRRHGVGRFTERVRSPRAGAVTVTVTHARTAQQVGYQARRRYAVLAEPTGFGSRGPFVALIQQRLAALHLFLRQSGVYDGGTGLAIDAYHRLLGWGTSQGLGGATISALLNGRGHFHIRFPRHGHHAEGNLGKQLLALADGGTVRYILPISSGKLSTPTILGDFHVYQRTPGYLPDGMYYSSFFIGGYAIHGYDPAPDFPASHGCMRLPIADAIPTYHWLGYGNWVDVYK